MLRTCNSAWLLFEGEPPKPNGSTKPLQLASGYVRICTHVACWDQNSAVCTSDSILCAAMAWGVSQMGAPLKRVVSSWLTLLGTSSKKRDTPADGLR